MMEFRKTSVPSPDDKSVMLDALDIPVVESTERWSEVHLADGSVFRVKLNVISVARIIGKVDKNGKPEYLINGQPSVALISVGKDPNDHA